MANNSNNSAVMDEEQLALLKDDVNYWSLKVSSPLTQSLALTTTVTNTAFHVDVRSELGLGDAQV